VLNVEEAEHCKRAKRLAQQWPRYAEPKRQLALAEQPLAGLQRAIKKSVAEKCEHLFGARQVLAFGKHRQHRPRFLLKALQWSDHSFRNAASMPSGLEMQCLLDGAGRGET
jgi:hypothetical protein